ncbi:MAG: type II toxin-antitoxin system VapC family toxin [Deltaproteobacteria bacterium]|nr:type II toxin-antitoxin system VapC family toxin [Deltaproteobacteria bacterium]
MLYIDTSVIVKLYIKEECSFEVSHWIRRNNEAIPLTRFHELEFKNAVYLKQFRTEMTNEQVLLVLSKFDDHQKRGVYYRPQINWTDTINFALDLSQSHTKTTGSRSLDILHVASALAIKANRFLTLDKRQSALAGLAGLTIENCAQ